MAKIDYAKIKALSQQILECIGEDSEGENPSLPKPDNALSDGGQEVNTSFINKEGDPKAGATEADGSGSSEEPDKKKKKDSALAMMGSMLASKFNK